MKEKLLLFIFFLLTVAIHAQVPVGEWTNYQSYHSASKLADVGELIYCAGNGGLFTYNKTDNSIQKLSTINGLSDVGIQELAYGSEQDVVLIAYKNSNIDLIFDKDIYNLSDIKRKQIMGNKAINKVMFDGPLAYLSCGFGIVVINTEKKEVKDTWYIAENGAHINVNDMVSDGTNLYAATDEGIYRALASEPNLQDYSNWQHIDNIPNNHGRFTQIENLNGKIIAAYSPENGNCEIYKLDNGGWSRVYTEIRNVYDMNVAFNDRILIANDGDVFVFNESGEVIDKIYQYIFADSQSQGIDPRCALLNADGTYWLADDDYGLVRKNGESCERVSPGGPVDNSIFSLTLSEENLWVATGGRNAALGNIYKQAQFQHKNEMGQWSLFNKENYPQMAGFHDIVGIAVDPNDPGHVFAASWGGGIFEFANAGFVERHSSTNSSLQSALPGEDYVRVGGLAFDKNNTLWVANGGGSNVLSSFTNGTWKSYSIPELATKYNLGNLVVTDDDDKWIIVPRSNDLYVVKGENEDRQWQRNIAYFTNGSEEILLPMHDVYSIAIDRDGAVWIGAAGGVAVYDNPERIWDTTNPLNKYARQPGLELGDDIYHPLLASETVTAIAVDGGNRKWCGTKANGVFLISEDGEEELEHFTVDNSPLLSDEITSIVINEKSGEVFLGTAEGLISYMGIATEPNDRFSDVYVYPNPVRETYDGPVVVTGLMEDTDVKITDISGNLVFHGTSFGGQVSWDGKNLNGNRCHTGVYLVFLNNKSGEETFVTKLLFIH